MNISLLSIKEQELITIINYDIEKSPHWAENLYEDNDPHSEMLVKYVMWGVNDSCAHYLNIVITQAPEHKLNVLGGYLLSGVVMSYLIEENYDYLNTLFIRFPNLLEKNEFWKGLSYKIYDNQNFKALFNVEKLFDSELKKCKEHTKEEHQSLFNNYNLYQKLNNKLQNKHNTNNTVKI